MRELAGITQLYSTLNENIFESPGDRECERSTEIIAWDKKKGFDDKENIYLDEVASLKKQPKYSNENIP
ncbi:3213_t:CDS:2, partial [Entrophospora sp. SA101]